MSSTANLIQNSHLYQQEDYEDPCENIDDNNYDMALEDNDGFDDIVNLDPAEQQKKFKDLLFCVQGVGSYQDINGFKVYVKQEHCLEFLKDIWQHIKSDSPKLPFLRDTLGDWNFFEKDLIPLIIFHKKDKKLAFLTTMIMVSLTEQPDPLCNNMNKMMNHLRNYKDAFLRNNVCSVLMEHLADCLQREERNDKHNNMIELIIVLFKQLLVIPDAPSKESSNHGQQNLQKRLLHLYADESVLDSFIYLTQDFSQPFFQKLSLHFLEIWYTMFQNFTPQQIFNPEEGERTANMEIEAQEKARQRRINFLKGTRHSKFGSQIQVRRDDGTFALIQNIYQKNIEINELKKGQRQRPQARQIKDQKSIIEAPQSHLIINDAAMEQSDKQLLKLLRDHLTDLLDNSYCPFIEQVQSLLQNKDNPNQTIEIEDNDKFHYFKLSTFMIQICRIRAYDSHKQLKLQALEEAKKAQAIEQQKNLFNLSKQKQPPLKVPKVPFNIDISSIGANLQLNNFQFLYGVLYCEVHKNKKSDRRIKDFHAGIQLLTQFLYIIRDMASSDDEKNKKNAQILQSNVFFHDLCKIAKAGFFLYEERSHHKQFLHDMIELTHLMLEMLEEYSKGKVLTIQTQKMRKVKKQKNKKVRMFGEFDEVPQNEEDVDADYDPNKPDQLEKDDDNIGGYMGYDGLDGLSDDEEDEEQQYVEKAFNFVGEISTFVDYSIISKYMKVISERDYVKSPILMQSVLSFFKRIVNQVKQPWIFYQLEYLNQFNQILNEGQTNNPLMRGINLDGPLTHQEKQVQNLMVDFRQLLVNITRGFLDTLQNNKLLGLEILFRFTSREHKDSVLSNYENMRAYTNRKESIDHEENEYDQQEKVDEDMTHEKQQEEKEKIEDPKNIWSQDQDDILIDNYDQFKDLGKKPCFEFLAQLIEGKKPKECYKRAKQLKLMKKGTDYARRKSRKLGKEVSQQLTSSKISFAAQKFMTLKKGDFDGYIEMISRIKNDFTDFKKKEEDLLLFGEECDVQDYQRDRPDFMLVPITKEQFDMLNDKDFQLLLASADVTNMPNSVFLSISNLLKKESLTSNLDKIIAYLRGTVSNDNEEQLNNNE